jgi:hypothetical protein
MYIRHSDRLFDAERAQPHPYPDGRRNARALELTGATALSSPMEPPGPWSWAIAFFGGKLVDPDVFPHSAEGFQQFLDATGIKRFTAKEMLTPHRRAIARRFGYSILLPDKAWWPRGAALAALADQLRALVGRPIRMRNWWRPRDYNKAVKGARTSDHIWAFGVDLDYQSAGDRRKAEAYLKEVRRANPWLEMSLGLGNRTTHVGLLSKRGERTWHYKSYRA